MLDRTQRRVDVALARLMNNTEHNFEAREFFYVGWSRARNKEIKIDRSIFETNSKLDALVDWIVGIEE